MKFWSRSTLGAFIGSFNVSLYVVCIVLIIARNDDGAKSHPQNEAMVAPFCILFAIMAVLSGLLVVGIIKRRHSFMCPWLIISAIGLVCNCVRVIMGLFSAVSAGISLQIILGAFAIGCFIVGLQSIILYPIYTLYRDIRAENEQPIRVGYATGQDDFNTEQTGHTPVQLGYPKKRNYYTPIEQKV